MGVYWVIAGYSCSLYPSSFHFLFQYPHITPYNPNITPIYPHISEVSTRNVRAMGYSPGTQLSLRPILVGARQLRRFVAAGSSV